MVFWAVNVHPPWATTWVRDVIPEGWVEGVLCSHDLGEESRLVLFKEGGVAAQAAAQRTQNGSGRSQWAMLYLCSAFTGQKLTGCKWWRQWTSSPLLCCRVSGPEPLELHNHTLGKTVMIWLQQRKKTPTFHCPIHRCNNIWNVYKYINIWALFLSEGVSTSNSTVVQHCVEAHSAVQRVIL